MGPFSNLSTSIVRGGWLTIIFGYSRPRLSTANCLNSHIRALSFLSDSTTRLTKKSSVLSNFTETSPKDTQWSVIAYNLSNELRIENSRKLLENFKEYQINEMSKDLQEVAIMLSLKQNESQRETTNALQSFHDIFLFREGSIVFWGVPYDQQKRILYGLSTLKVDPNAGDLIREEKEHMNFKLIDSSQINSNKSLLLGDTIHLANHQDYQLLMIDQFTVSHAICTSVKLGIWELTLDQYIESIEWITQSMKDGRTVKMTRGDVFKKTGEIYELKHRINLSSDLLDLPDIYWDRADQENLFMSILSHLNVRRRTAVINDKLSNCCELMNLLAGHMNDKHHVRLEWMIIILILVEVIFEISKFL